MGKKRSVSVKRLAEMLLKLNPQSFTSDFNENKTLVEEMMTSTSKTIRNQVAGYITSIKGKPVDIARISRLAVTIDSNQPHRRGRYRRRSHM